MMATKRVRNKIQEFLVIFLCLGRAEYSWASCPSPTQAFVQPNRGIRGGSTYVHYWAPAECYSISLLGASTVDYLAWDFPLKKKLAWDFPATTAIHSLSSSHNPP